MPAQWRPLEEAQEFTLSLPDGVLHFRCSHRVSANSLRLKFPNVSTVSLTWVSCFRVNRLPLNVVLGNVSMVAIAIILSAMTGQKSGKKLVPQYFSEEQ